MAKHFIQRVVIDIHDDDRAHAVSLQNDMSALFRAKLIARLDAILTEYDTGQIIRIDELAIDLGVLHRAHLERDVLRRFDDALREALRQAIGTPRHPRTTSQAPTPQSSTQHHLQTLTYFLQHGRLPPDSPQHLEVNALLLHAIKTQPQLVRKQLQPLLRDRNAVYRLAFSLQRHAQSALLQLLSPQTHDRLILGLDNILAIYGFAPNSTAQQQLQQRVFHTYFAALQQSLLTRQSLILTDQDLQTALAPLLPQAWQSAAPHLLSPQFTAQNPALPDAAALAAQPQSALINALQDPELRYRLLQQDPNRTLDPVLQKLAGSKTQALKKRLQRLLATWNIPSAYRKQLEMYAWSSTLLYLADRTQLAKLKLSELEQHLTEELTQYSRYVRWRTERTPSATPPDWSALPTKAQPLPDLTALHQALQGSVQPAVADDELTDLPAPNPQAFAEWMHQQLSHWPHFVATATPPDATIAPDTPPFGEWLNAQHRQWIDAMQRHLPPLDAAASPDTQRPTPTSSSDLPPIESRSNTPLGQENPPLKSDDALSTPDGEARTDNQASARPTSWEVTEASNTPLDHPEWPFGESWWPSVAAQAPAFAERPQQALAEALLPLNAQLEHWLQLTATPLPRVSASPQALARATHLLTQSIAQAWAQIAPVAYSASPPAVQASLRALGAALRTAIATPPESPPDLAPVRDWMTTLRLQTREIPDAERWFQVLAAFAERLEQVLETWEALAAATQETPTWTAQALLDLIAQAQATVYAQARPAQQSAWAAAVAPLVQALQSATQSATESADLLAPALQELLRQAGKAVAAILQSLPAPPTNRSAASTTQEHQLALSALEVIEQFLRRGYVSEQLPDINAVMAFVAQHEPARLRNLLQRIGREVAVQQRVKSALSVETQRLLIRLLAPQGLDAWAWAERLPAPAYGQWIAAALHSILAFRRMEAHWVIAQWVEQQADEEEALAQLRSVAPTDDPLLAPLLDWYDDTLATPDAALEAWAGAQAWAYLDRGIWEHRWDSPLPASWLQTGLDYVLSHPDMRQRWTTLRLFDQPTQRLDALVEVLNEGQRSRLLHLFFRDTVGFLATLILALQEQMDGTLAWQAVARAAFQQPEGTTHTGRLLADGIRQAAQLQRRPTKAVIEALNATAAAQAVTLPRFKPLQQLLRHLPQQLPPFANKAAPKPPSPEAEEATHWRMVLDYLRYGNLARRLATPQQLTAWVQAGSSEAVDFWRIGIRRLYRERTRVWQQQLDVDAELVLALTHQLQPLAKRDWDGYLHDLSLHLDNSTLQAAILQRIADLPHWDSAAQLAERVAQTAVQAIALAQKRDVSAVWEEWESALRGSATRSNLAKIVKRQQLQAQRSPKVEVPDTTVPEPPKPRPTPIKLDTTIYTEQAGIVLLWVFFPHLYTMLELTENRAFKDTAAMLKALHLLYYTATGTEEPQEFQLALEKILCALPLDHPLGPRVALDPSDREACDQLVQAALNRWQKLKNTTVAGFRASFLKRQGRLTKTSKGWSLTVEQKPFDLLLKSLPWGIAIVRFPWMEEPVYIDWV